MTTNQPEYMATLDLGRRLSAPFGELAVCTVDDHPETAQKRRDGVWVIEPRMVRAAWLVCARLGGRVVEVRDLEAMR